MDPVQQAIQAALSRDWKRAITLNLSHLKVNPGDIDALNRLGRAYFEHGEKTKAEQIYKKVLRLDKFNSIALKSMELLKTSRITHGNSHSLGTSTPPPIFLEEPGLTRTVSPTRLGDPKVVSRLHPGDSVNLIAREHCVNVVSVNSEYLGRLPDDLASRLRPFLKAGNKYHAWIRSVDPLKIFIKEVSRAAKFRHIPSFPVTEKMTYAAFTPPELVHEEKPKIFGVDGDSDDHFRDREDGDTPESADQPAADD